MAALTEGDRLGSSPGVVRRGALRGAATELGQSRPDRSSREIIDTSRIFVQSTDSTATRCRASPRRPARAATGCDVGAQRAICRKPSVSSTGQDSPPAKPNPRLTFLNAPWRPTFRDKFNPLPLRPRLLRLLLPRRRYPYPQPLCRKVR